MADQSVSQKLSENPDAQEKRVAKQESGHALVGAGDLHYRQAQIPVGVVLEVSVSNAARATIDWRFTIPNAVRAGVHNTPVHAR